MPEPYSLVRQQWIPVATRTRQRVFVRPCDITSPIEGELPLRVDTGRPDCDISLTEFLIGLLAVIIGPEERPDWRLRYRKPPLREELQAALEPFAHALVLDGDGPRFFQDFDALDGQPTPVAALFIDSPGEKGIKDNADHFVKRGQITTLARPAAAIALLTLQTSAPSGGAGHRTSLRGGGPLSTIVVPGTADRSQPTLWQRLWANVPDGSCADKNEAVNVFPWLGKTRVSDTNGATTTPDDVHRAQAFFGMPRRIRLVFEENKTGRPCDLLGLVDDLVVTSYVTRPWGTNYTAWSKGHPLSPYYRPKANDPEYLPLHLQSSRVGYRQWLGLVAQSPDKTIPAACVTNFCRRAADFEGEDSPVSRDHRLLVAGYAMDNMKPLDFAEALLPLIVTGDERCDEAVAELARRFITAAENVANQLSNSVKRALFGERSKAERDSAVLEPVRSRFWADTEDAFYRVLHAGAAHIEANRNALDDLSRLIEPGGKDWLAEIKRHALRIFDETVPIEDAESERLEDVIAGRKSLVWSLTGKGPVGKSVFDALRQPLPENGKRKKGGKAA